MSAKNGPRWCLTGKANSFHHKLPVKNHMSIASYLAMSSGGTVASHSVIVIPSVSNIFWGGLEFRCSCVDLTGKEGRSGGATLPGVLPGTGELAANRYWCTWWRKLSRAVSELIELLELLELLELIARAVRSGVLPFTFDWL